MKLYVRIANFQLQLPNTLSNVKMVRILNVDLHDLKTFSFQVIKWVIWPSLKHSILNFERIHCHALVFGTLESLGWKSHEYQYCSTHQDLDLIYRPFLHLTECWEVVVENPQFSHIVSYSLCEIQDLVSIVYLNFLKQKMVYIKSLDLDDL